MGLILQRASVIVIRQSTPRWRSLTSVAQAAISDCNLPKSPMRRPLGHWRVIALNSFSAMFSQLPCFGV